MSFFSRFFAIRKDIANDIKNSQNGVSERRYSQNSVLCMKLIWTYMMSCKWHNTERTKRLMTFITLKDSEIAERLNIENNTVRCHKSNYSAKLYEKLGDDCFTIVCSSDERAKRNLIYKLRYLIDGYSDISSFVPSSVVDSIMLTPREGDQVYDFKDCIKEITFLARFSLIDMARSIDNLDEDKLAFIFEVLMDANAHTNELQKEKLIKLILMGEDKIKDRRKLL